MKLTALSHSRHPGFTPLSVLFDSPGGTIGAAPQNTLALPAGDGLCRVQAALRVAQGQCALLNLSGMSPVSINGRALAPWEEAPVREGDRIEIGPYVLAAGEPAAAAPDSPPADPLLADPLLADPLLADPLLADPLLADPSGGDPSGGGPRPDRKPAADPLPAQTPAAAEPAAPQTLAGAPAAGPASAPADDVFADLFGPGTLPVGSAPDVHTHPFAMDSAMSRNPADPLADLAPADPGRARARDPLDAFATPDSAHLRHVLSDLTPSTLHEGEAAANPSSPIGGTLRAGHSRDERGAAPQRHAARDYSGGHLRPPTPKR